MNKKPRRYRCRLGHKFTVQSEQGVLVNGCPQCGTHAVSDRPVEKPSYTIGPIPTVETEIRPMPFGDEAQNGLYTAIQCCGLQWAVMQNRIPSEFDGHAFLGEAATVQLVTMLVASLRKNGYDIIPVNTNESEVLCQKKNG